MKREIDFMENNFANNLKHLRIQSDMTQVELAKKLNKDYSTIGKWELGQRCPMMTDVIKIAKLFNVSVDDLIIKDLIQKKEINNISKTNEYDEFEIFFNKNKKILSNNDKEIIKVIIEQRKKENKVN
jgi:DNA-binding XRE family transcriptional regulator